MYDDRFWSARAEGSSDSVRAIGDEPTDGELMRDRSVQLAFEQLRDQPALDLTVTPELAFDRSAVVEGNKIVLREALVVPGCDDAVRFVFGVNLPELVRLVAGSRDVSSLIERYHARVAVIDPRHILVGLSFLVSKGLVKARER